MSHHDSRQGSVIYFQLPKNGLIFYHKQHKQARTNTNTESRLPTDGADDTNTRGFICAYPRIVRLFVKHHYAGDGASFRMPSKTYGFAYGGWILGDGGTTAINILVLISEPGHGKWPLTLLAVAHFASI
jgi:hypothetical protein